MEVKLIDYMGTDLLVVNAARVSMDKESEWDKKEDYSLESLAKRVRLMLKPNDRKLIKYLARHNHWTPFGHPQVTFRVKAPIFVARQLGKHQVGMVWNEVSRRYVDSEPEFYEPKVWRKKADNVKQGSSDKEVDVGHFRDCYSKDAVDYYNWLLTSGVCPEQARMVLPQSMYTEWYWTGSLAAWSRVCKLRLDPHTQRETQEIAKMISDKMSKLFPVSWEALSE